MYSWFKESTSARYIHHLIFMNFYWGGEKYLKDVWNQFWWFTETLTHKIFFFFKDYSLAQTSIFVIDLYVSYCVVYTFLWSYFSPLNIFPVIICKLQKKVKVLTLCICALFPFSKAASFGLSDAFMERHIGLLQQYNGVRHPIWEIHKCEWETEKE